MTSEFNKASSNPFKAVWTLMHKLCVISMLGMAFAGAPTFLGAGQAFAHHIMQGLSMVPDALTHGLEMLVPAPDPLSALEADLAKSVCGGSLSTPVVTKPLILSLK